MTDDPRVSEAYRETAAERAPGRLDTAVLRDAARAVRPRYSLLRTWSRPVAWAAVVMLSFGLVLELTRAPEPPLQDEVPMKTERPRQDAQELRVTDTDMLQRAEDMARMREGPDDTPAQPASALAEREAFADAAPQAAVPLSEKSALRSAASLAEPEPACDATARAGADTWLACIRALEQAGRTESAHRERELYDDAFGGDTQR